MAETFEEIRPLTDDDIDAERSKIVQVDQKELNNIFNEYIQQINGLITLALKRLNDDDEIVELERVKRLANLLPADECFLRSKDKFWGARKMIIEKNADWFINRDYSKLIKRDEKQVMIETIVSVIKEQYKSMSEAERELYWNKALSLLNIVARYKKLVKGVA